MRTTTLVLALLLLAGCGEQPAATDPGLAKAPDQLSGRVFVGDAVTGHALVQGSVLRLDFTDGLRVDAGCNHLGGEAEVTDGVLVATISSMTEMGCDPARMDQDTWVIDFLESRPAATVDGPVLTLVKDAVTVTLTDEEHLEAQRPVSLEGTVWELESLVRGEVASSSPGARRPTIRIAGGQVTLFTGCNHGSGEVVVGEGILRFGPLGVTTKPCPDGPERSVLDVLGGEVAFEHDHDRLTLTKHDRSLVFRARRDKS